MLYASARSFTSGEGTRRETAASSSMEIAGSLTRLAISTGRIGAPCFARNTPDPHEADHVHASGHVRARRKASQLEAVCAPHGVHAPRAWSCGSNTARGAPKGARATVSYATAGAVRRGARGATIGTSEVGTVTIEALPARKARRVSRCRYRGTRALRLRQATASNTGPPKLARLTPSPTSRTIQAARTALGLGCPPPSP
jgi:hypothetical protein